MLDAGGDLQPKASPLVQDQLRIDVGDLEISKRPSREDNSLQPCFTGGFTPSQQLGGWEDAQGTAAGVEALPGSFQITASVESLLKHPPLMSQ